MSVSIEQIETSLKLGQCSMPKLLRLRRELNAPFKLHPLGFIVCTLFTEGHRKLRLHYWPKGGHIEQSPQCRIHDHLFELKSWVLAGSIENIEYSTSPKGLELAVYRAGYVGNKSILTKTEETIKVSVRSRAVYDTGSCYVVHAGTLHESVRVSYAPAATVLVTTDMSTAAPLVLGSIAGPANFEFKRETIPEPIAEEMLAELLAPDEQQS